MDKYRLVEEKYIGAQGFIDDSKMTGDSRPDGSELDAESTVRITQQAKPRRCITTAMNMLVSDIVCSYEICFYFYTLQCQLIIST